jgi:alpha-L-fucosidase
MDPFSYGYNRATPDNAYMNASTIVTSLIDIISKNGNFLLDVGPQANGTIIAVEQNNLRQAGVWIKDHAEAIFNTTYWFITPEENNGTKEIRFTQTMDAFYVISLTQPNGSIVLDSPVPWVEGDAVTVVGGNSSGTVVPSQLLSNGSLMLNIFNQVQQADEFAWVFKIPYVGQNGSNGKSTPTGSTPTPSSISSSDAAKAMQRGGIGLLYLSLAMFFGF